MALPPETDFQPRPSSPGSRAKKPELSFAPLSEGLGFHPFSDGLPYAPVGKTPNVANKANIQLKSGDGAVAAGLPGYAPPPPRIPTRIQAPRIPATPSTTPLATRAPQPFAHPRLHPGPARSPQKPTSSEALAAAISPDLLEPRLGMAYVAKRVFAYLIDSACNLSLCARFGSRI